MHIPSTSHRILIRPRPSVPSALLICSDGLRSGARRQRRIQMCGRCQTLDHGRTRCLLTRGPLWLWPISSSCSTPLQLTVASSLVQAHALAADPRPTASGTAHCRRCRSAANAAIRGRASRLTLPSRRLGLEVRDESTAEGGRRRLRGRRADPRRCSYFSRPLQAFGHFFFAFLQGDLT